MSSSMPGRGRRSSCGVLTPPSSFVEYVNVLANNTALATAEAKFQRAEIAYGTIKTAGVGEFRVLYILARLSRRVTDSNVAPLSVELNTMELRPPMMDLSGRTKYPVLFQV